MDPISAVGIAASVIQFVSFASSLVSGAQSLHYTKSSRTQWVVKLTDLTESLQSLNSNLSACQPQELSQPLSPRNIEIGNLCKACNRVVDRFLSVLNTLQSRNKIAQAKIDAEEKEKARVEGTSRAKKGWMSVTGKNKAHDNKDTNGWKAKPWHNFRDVLVELWKRDEIEALEKELNSYRELISLYLIASIREQNEATAVSQIRRDQNLSNSLQSLQISADLSVKALLQLEKNTKWQADAIRAASGLDGSMATSTKDLCEEFEKRFSKSICSKLRYTEIDSRYERIPQAFTNTFDWLFAEPAVDQRWSSFVDFLEGDQQLYWITGKPGAGKSTLMKYISQNPDTVTCLERWASGQKLVTIGFFFWCSGGELQMSEEGFMRALLLDLLQQLPDLGPIAFPDEWEPFILCGELGWDANLTLPQLLRVFKAVVQEAKRTTKIFFIIDGLDEFKGGQKYQVKLIDFIHSLLNPQIKICVASRPWNHFKDTFKSRPKLRTEDLTRPDIEHFVSSKLHGNAGFEELQMDQATYAATLIENVTDKASGVFLWVVLVVESLLEGLTNGERLADLQRRLDSLPADLEKLFWSILNSVDIQRASQMLLIVRTASPITLIQLYFADKEDQDFAFNLATAPLSDEYSLPKATNMKRRLNACCKGLLEVERQSAAHREPLPLRPIGYLHRTVRDFILRQDVGTRLEGTIGTFDLPLHICLMKLAWFKTMHVEFWDRLLELINLITHLNCPAEMQTRFLVEVDVAAGGVMVPDDSDIHWTQLLDDPLCYSFLHFAVRLHLLPFLRATVDSTLNSLDPQIRTNTLSSLLETAITRPTISTFPLPDAIRHSPFSKDVVTFLLEQGANPNAFLRRQPPLSPHHTTIWGAVVMRGDKNEIFEAFLQHGANPFQHSVLDNIVDQRMISLVSRKQKGWKMNHKTTPKKWVRQLFVKD